MREPHDDAFASPVEIIDVMLDLETMGTRPDAAITSIGAVAVDLAPVIRDEKIIDEFYQKVDLADAAREGGTIDANTVVWWLSQGEEARSEMTTVGIGIREALTEFTSWLDWLSITAGNEGTRFRIWGCGAGFDNTILRSAYDRARMPVPWTFRDDRCYRTLRAMYPDVPLNGDGPTHNALADARRQAEHLIDIAATTPDRIN